MDGSFQSTVMQKEKRRPRENPWPLLYFMYEGPTVVGSMQDVGFQHQCAQGAADPPRAASRSLQAVLIVSLRGLHTRAILQTNLAPKIVETHMSLKSK